MVWFKLHSHWNLRPVAIVAIFYSLFLLKAATAGTTSDPSSTFQPRFTPSPCQIEFYEPRPGDRVECGFLEVAENRLNPDSAILDIEVAVLRSKNNQPAATPVLFLAGGPGSGALDEIQLFLNLPLRETHDIYLVDQRGAGYSSPNLECVEFDALDARLARRDLSAEQATALIDMATRVCRQALDRQVNLAMYNSAAIAADMEDLRVALAIDQWILLGVSYGTRIALTMMRDFPKGIRAAVLDSTVPVQVNYFEEGGNTVERVFRLLFQRCEASECAESYPDLEAKFKATVAKLNSQPMRFTLLRRNRYLQRFELNGEQFLEIIYDAFHDHRMIPFLPKAIDEISQGRSEAWRDYGLLDRPPSYFQSLGMAFSVHCYEEVPFNQNVDFKDDRFALYRGFLKRTTIDRKLCGNWGVPEAEKVENQPVISQIPTLILSGEFDPVTPPSWGVLAGQSLSNSYVIEFPALSHGVSFRHRCPQAIRDAFIQNPSVKPKLACLQDMGEINFR